MQESNSEDFNHLKIHSQFSICEGAIKLDDLKDISKDNKLKAIGLCDTSNLCGALEFAEKLSKSGSQPIIETQINYKLDDKWKNINSNDEESKCIGFIEDLKDKEISPKNPSYVT